MIFIDYIIITEDIPRHFKWLYEFLVSDYQTFLQPYPFQFIKSSFWINWPSIDFVVLKLFIQGQQAHTRGK